MSKSQLDKYGPGQVDGTSFVVPKSEANQILANAGGNKRVLEDSLGLPNGFLYTNELVRIDVPNPKSLNARVPSGNEPIFYYNLTPAPL